MIALRQTCSIGLTSLILALSGAQAVWPEQIDPVDELTRHLVPEKVQAAVLDMPEDARKLLALRSYLRSAKILKDRWSWTDKEIADFQGTDAQLALQDEIDAISARFAQSNPGYQIYVHSRVRSLETQIAHWNENPSVGAVADDMQAAWLEENFDLDDPDGIKRAGRWLKSYSPKKRAPLAAPGLSRHGRAHAIDFQIKMDGEIIAATKSSQIDTVWAEDHWEDKLNAAVVAAGPSFTGPLTSPHEPWHYDYAPASEVISP